MENYNYYICYVIFFVLFFIIVNIYLFSIKKENFDVKKNKLFYEISDLSNENLNLIEKYKENILNETLNLCTQNRYKNWEIWPEKDLYNNEDGWKIFPFYAFDFWIKENCKKCPSVYNFLKKIKGLKLATLSKLSPGTKLNIHQGWGSHSNHVIRCHYGLVIPEEAYSSYIYVEDDYDSTTKNKQYHKKFEWIIFDDSKPHYAENSGSTDRIVLIIDVLRPLDIQVGKSEIGDTHELLEIVNYLRKKVE
jgi:aspartyl/asparaginyl beta-hydroxylase (cupin superfamily)